MSVSRDLPWFRLDERIYVDALSLEAALRDFADQLDREYAMEGAGAVRRVADIVSLIGQPGEIHA